MMLVAKLVFNTFYFLFDNYNYRSVLKNVDFSCKYEW